MVRDEIRVRGFESSRDQGYGESIDLFMGADIYQHNDILAARGVRLQREDDPTIVLHSVSAPATLAPRNPFCRLDRLGPRLPGSRHNHFVPNSLWHEQIAEQLADEVQPADPRQAHQRRCIANQDHRGRSSERAVRSSSYSWMS